MTWPREISTKEMKNRDELLVMVKTEPHKVVDAIFNQGQLLADCKARLAKAREALRFYAPAEHWRWGPLFPPIPSGTYVWQPSDQLINDRGEKARECLKELGE